MLRVQKSELKGVAVLALSGRIGGIDLLDLKQILEAHTGSAAITLDLAEVRLVDREAVRFLSTCEARGIQLRNCPSYIREWMDRGEQYES